MRHRLSFRAICSLAIVVTVAGLALSAPLKGLAMGSTASPSAVIDIERPSDWSGIRGYVASGDSAPLGGGNIRVYRARKGQMSGLPASVVTQADLLFPLAAVLRDGPALPPLTDVTDLATQAGASPKALAQAQSAGGKTTLPNQILAIGAATDAPAVVLMRRAVDAPDAAVNVTLYCFGEFPDLAVKISYLGPVAPDFLIEIKDGICATRFD